MFMFFMLLPLEQFLAESIIVLLVEDELIYSSLKFAVTSLGFLH